MSLRQCLVVAVLIVSCISVGLSLKLPSYIKPCSRNDPDLSGCVLRNGQISLTQMIKTGGDRKYNIPNVSPLTITELFVDQNGLMLKFTNMKLYGLEDIDLTEATMDLKKKHSEIAILVPRMQVIADYEISGRILLLPIQGNGPANITMPNVVAHGSYDFDLRKGKSGKEHMFIKNTQLNIVKSKAFIKLDNLFGNKQLSDNLNTILNENSEEVIGDVGPAVAEALAQVIQQIFNGLFSVVPYDDVFPETV